MKREHVKYLACPNCKSELEINQVYKEDSSSIKEGTLKCIECAATYDIIRHIPRFVTSEHYTEGFGLEWRIHSRTQYDSYSGANISETRFFEETRWPKRMDGEVVLEVGSGSGRFTEQASSTGAMVVSMDLSLAVEANYSSNGPKKNVLIVQADIYKMPFKNHSFDKIFCFGVMQHTPDAKEAFKSICTSLKKDGNTIVDVYARYPGVMGSLKKALTTKYWVRPLTKEMPPEQLYKLCKKYVEFMWPLARLINKIPCFGRRINLKLLIADYGGMFNLSDKMLREWAVLDTFDTLSPKYDRQYSISEVKSWFDDAGLKNVEVNYGYNGIEGRGTRLEESNS